MRTVLVGILVPGILAISGVFLLAWWLDIGPIRQSFAVPAWVDVGPTGPLTPRETGQDDAPPFDPLEGRVRVEAGQPVLSDVKPSQIAGSWPWFRGEKLDAICDDGVPLADQWGDDGPAKLWAIELGEGYAGAAVRDGCVYVLDHAPDLEMEWLQGLSAKERNTLADALSRLTPETFGDVEPVLARLFPIEGKAPADAPRIVSQQEYDDLRAAVLEFFSAGRDVLVTALRTGTLASLDRSRDVMRCLSLDDGREIWSNGYPAIVPYYHGRSRTVPALVDKYVISLGPQCHVACWDAATGACVWMIDLVLDHGATVPEWYAGQCPLIDPVTDRLILAPGGKDELLIAVDYRTGEVVWKSPNPQQWKMTHVSITPMDYAGQRMVVYCGHGGVAGVAADDGRILWDTTDWQIGTATCPSPVVIGDGRLFFCGGYNAGSQTVQLRKQADGFAVDSSPPIEARQFGSEQQTPVLYNGHLYAVRQNGKQLVCLDLEGNEVWNSGRQKFGAGPYMIADGKIYVMDDRGWLTMARATPTRYDELARAQVIEHGHDSWGPMAMVAGRLIVRDMTRMVCLDVR
ncbi:MAG: PQQ-binding-like beta-propeller repeat protein [Candidatus Nealsonbacteria bacterium]|nr:PQQ-binding-like beta-propeller repeat protein [Candidatus Nealsonbacteria bacterium]